MTKPWKVEFCYSIVLMRLKKSLTTSKIVFRGDR